jgi:hypothetical protein
MRAKIIKKLPSPSNFFDPASVYISTMYTLENKFEVKRMIKYLSFLFWPFSPKKLRPIKVMAPAANTKG